MTNAIERRNDNSAAMMEQVIVGGDLAQLKPAERLAYYRNVCESVGLNPLTKPFEYIKLNGKLTLYARRDAADQLRRIRGISLARPEIEYGGDLVIVTIVASDRDGRSDADVGAVALTGLRGEARANAIMKAITKAKRRVTLSIAGLGWLDETETETIPGAQRVVVEDTGEIVDAAPAPASNGAQPATPGVEADVDMGMGGDDNPFEGAQPWYARTRGQLTNGVATLTARLLDKHRNSNGAVSAKQYGYLAGLIDAIVKDATGATDGHKRVLPVVCQSDISRNNLPGADVVETLLKHLPTHVTDAASGEKLPNPDYSKPVADAMIAIYRAAEAVSTPKLFDAA